MKHQRHALTRRIAVPFMGALTAVALAATPASAAPDPKPSMPGGLEDKLDSLLGLLMALVIVACVAGVLLAAGKMALAYRRGEGGEAAGQLGFVLAACILVASASGLVAWAVG